MSTHSIPHRRYNPLTGEYVLVSPHRMDRPVAGQARTAHSATPARSTTRTATCAPVIPAWAASKTLITKRHMCFTNDFPALLPDANEDATPDGYHPLLNAQTVRGTCRVLCFSPRHDLTLPEMPLSTIRNVVDMWDEQITDLGQTYPWVQVFQNKGELMGASNPHPHGQVWAETVLPNEAAKEDHQQRRYYSNHGTPMLVDYVTLEAERGERVVVENDDWLAVVPFWAVWPFEVLLLPRRAVRHLPELNDGERDALADILKRLLTRYDNLFETSFPYSMGWHGAPFNGEDNHHWQLHAHFYPPLLRSASVRKWMVGYEMLGESQRDLTAEAAAQRLRDLPAEHYRTRD